ncbi:MAG: YicC/YloC family endoribonuclease [Methylococcales bacterium]
MIHSMTAFSTHEIRHGNFTLGWELRTVNHRYLDIYLKLPEPFRFLDPDLRAAIAQTLKRGKVDCVFFYRQSDEGPSEISIDPIVTGKLLAAITEVEELMQVSKAFSALDLMTWPGVMREPGIDLDGVASKAKESLHIALTQLLSVREREGQQLARLVSERCAQMDDLITRVRIRRPEAVEAIRNKIRLKLSELNVDTDNDRLEQELVYLAQKMDVAEELDRLEAHIKEVKRVLELNEPSGRRMDFLMQEMNREANTLTSKSADLETTQHAVEMKVLIEQMREQIQNIE